MDIDHLIIIILNNTGTLFFAVAGAFFLTTSAIKEHLDRDPKDKMSKNKYFMYLIGWIFGYPFLGLIVATAYIANDNHFGSWLALQIGATSPAILIGMVSRGANSLAKDPVPTVSDQ